MTFRTDFLESACPQAPSALDTGARLSIECLASPHGGPYDLQLAAGECVAIMGASGSGKSVLLRLAADLDPSTGEVSLDGRSRTSMTAPSWRRQVVYQAAEPGWWAATAIEHFEAGSRSRIEPMLASLGMASTLLDAPIDRLSTGERQRMALVRSLARAPSVLLLDEPTASLDAASVLAAEALLHDQLAAGTTIVLVTHSAEQAQRMGHRRFLLKDKTLHAAS